MGPQQLAIYGVAAFFMSILSGIAGAGGGFVMTPLSIFLGLAPAQAVSSGKLNGVAITIGSLTTLRNYPGKVSRRRILIIMLMALLIGLIVPFVIKSFDNRFYRLALGIMLLIILPILYYRRAGQAQQRISVVQKTIGNVLLPVSFFIEGIFSGGAGALTSMVLIGLFGQTAIEAQITRRWAQLVLNVTILIGLLTSGLIFWPVALVGSCSSFIGSMIGGRLAVKEGDRFAANILFTLAAVSAIVLIIGAL